MKILIQDIRQSIRSLRKTRGFTWTAIGTLALGIAANVIVFSIIDAVILRPLPFKNANQIVVALWQNVQLQPQSEVSAPVFFLLKDHSQSFETVAAVNPQGMGINLSGVQAPRYVTFLRVSESYFEVLGTEPAQGRRFTHEEDQSGAPGAVILSHHIWESVLDRDPSAVGRAIKLNGAPFTIIGIMPPGFHSYPDADIWTPLQLTPANANPGSDYLVLGSLRRQVLTLGAEREAESLVERYHSSYFPGVSSSTVRLRLERLESFRTKKFRRNLDILFGAVVLVMVVACTNLVVLIMVRGFSRSQEFSVRLALGSSQPRLFQGFLIEGLILAGLGGAIGLALAFEALPWVLSFVPADLTQAGTIQVNRPALVYALILSLLVALLSSLVPAIKVAGSRIHELLRQVSRGVTADLRQTRLAQICIGVETALAVVVLGSALLLLQSFWNLEGVNPGFDPHQVWIAQLSLAADRYRTTKSSEQLLRHIVENLQNRFDIEAVGTINGLPLEQGLNSPIYPTEAPGKIRPATQYRIVSGDYFKSLKIPIVSGRSFLDSDSSNSRPVAIVNQTVAQRWWPGGNAIGHFVRAGEEMGLADEAREIVGVAANAHDVGLSENPPAVVFVPVQQVPDSITAFVNKLFPSSLVVRSKGQENVAPDITNAVASADPDLSIASLRPMSQVVKENLSIPMFYAWLTSSFALFSLLFTAVGLYGLLSYQVTLRTPEIGLRLAMGAGRLQIIVLILKRGAQLSFVGMTLGLIVSVPLARVLNSMVYNPHHVILQVLAGEALLLGSVASLASLLSAIRASGIDPMTVLRNQ